MKKIESLLGYLSLVGLLGTAGLAIFVIGNLIFQGSPETATAAVSESATQATVETVTKTEETAPATTAETPVSAPKPAVTPEPVKVADAGPIISAEAGEKFLRNARPATPLMKVAVRRSVPICGAL
ncbi:hypothetical protein [Profundibacter sp.]|uniref:hypothetical protein n=1 Tax=Profundibacter sp. TaxID=3101071 RepID=UPI003D0A85FC